MSVLLLGLSSSSTIPFQNSQNDSFSLSLTEIAFAQETEDDEAEENDEVEAEEEEAEEKEIEIGAEVEDGIAKVNVEIDDDELEFEFKLVSSDPDEIRDEIVAEILVRTDLTIAQINDFEMEFEAEEEEIEEAEDELLEDGTESSIKVKAGTLGDQSEVRAELEFITDSIDLDSIIDEIIEAFALTREETDSILEIEPEDDELEEKFEVEIEIENGFSEVDVELRFIVDSTDRDVILDAIEENTQLTVEQINSILELEVDETEEEEIEEAEEEEFEETEGAPVDKVEICHVPPGNPSKAHTITVGESAVEMHLAHGDVLGPCDGQEFGISGESAFALKQAERESRLAEKQMEIEERLAEKEAKALQRTEQLIQKLEQRIEQLEQRLQTLLVKVESGEYYGNVPEIDRVVNSYSISIDGTASSLFDEAVISDVTGEIFIENLVTSSKVSKFKVTGGEIFVGENIYDIVFGKARVSSTGQSGEKDTMVLILQTIDSEGFKNTIRLTLDFDSALEGDFGSNPIELEILENSNISGQWSLSATGQLSLLSS